ncbi:MAG: hypothetical protein JKY54_18185, partial [Flavobacteriales bacterium]|nr:hypothetical protein [Flavobacteriales bacterium]
MSEENIDTDLERSINALECAEKFSEQQNDIYGLAKVYESFAKLFISKFQDFEKGKAYAELIHELAIQNNNPQLLAQYHYTVGHCYYYEKIDRDKGGQEFIKARNILDENNLPITPS